MLTRFKTSSDIHLSPTYIFWFKHDLGQTYYAPQVRPDWGSNSWPLDHDSAFHVTETPALTTRPSVSQLAYTKAHLSLPRSCVECHPWQGRPNIPLWAREASTMISYIISCKCEPGFTICAQPIKNQHEIQLNINLIRHRLLLSASMPFYYCSCVIHNVLLHTKKTQCSVLYKSYSKFADDSHKWSSDRGWIQRVVVENILDRHWFRAIFKTPFTPPCPPESIYLSNVDCWMFSVT